MQLGMEWIKIRTDMVDDEKIKAIRKEYSNYRDILYIWDELLKLMGRGYYYEGAFTIPGGIALDVSMIAKSIREDANFVSECIKLFLSIGFMYMKDDAYAITNWEKHQETEKRLAARKNNNLSSQKSKANRKQSNSNHGSCGDNTGNSDGNSYRNSESNSESNSCGNVLESKREIESNIFNTNNTHKTIETMEYITKKTTPSELDTTHTDSPAEPNKPKSLSDYPDLFVDKAAATSIASDSDLFNSYKQDDPFLIYAEGDINILKALSRFEDSRSIQGKELSYNDKSILVEDLEKLEAEYDIVEVINNSTLKKYSKFFNSPDAKKDKSNSVVSSITSILQGGHCEKPSLVVGLR